MKPWFNDIPFPGTLKACQVKTSNCVLKKSPLIMNLNLSASVNIFKLLAKPSLCLPHATIATFDNLPVPLDKLFTQSGKKTDIRAVVLDKDDCFAYPESSQVYDAYKVGRQPSYFSSLHRPSVFTCPLEYMDAKETETFRSFA